MNEKELKKLIDDVKKEENNKKYDIKTILEKIRKDNKETMTAMAKKLGYSHSYLSLIESGKRPIPKDFKDRILRNYILDKETTKKLKKDQIIKRNELFIDLSNVSKEKKEKLLEFLEENNFI